MNTATAKSAGTSARRDSKLPESLNQVLADTYSLMALSHLAHWNVEGPGFFQLHQAFEQHYTNLFEASDEIAERVRALDAYAVGGLGALGRLANLEEFKAPMPQKDYVAALVVCHEKLVDDAIKTRDMAAGANDLETQDLMIKRIEWHQKTIWMLKSFLK